MRRRYLSCNSLVDGGKRPRPAVALLLLVAILPLAPVSGSVGEGEDGASSLIPARRRRRARVRSLPEEPLEAEVGDDEPSVSEPTEFPVD